jgi:thioredoxin-related protein
MRRVTRIVLSGTLAVLTGLGVLVTAVFGEDRLWLSSFEAATAKAKAEKKLLLVSFVGSDWCVFCKKLKSEILDKEAFRTQVPKKFVLVELDYPRTKELPQELKEQNAKLSRQYKIHGFPTVLVLDAQGHTIAKTGYRRVSPEDYVNLNP